MARPRRRTLRGLALAAACAVLGVPAGVWAWFAGGDRPLDGARVEGLVVGAEDDVRDVVRLHADAWLGTPVTIDAGPLVTSASRLAMGGRVDVDEEIERVLLPGRSGNPLADLRSLRAALDGELDVTLTPRVEREAALRFLSSLRPRIERTPIPTVIGQGGAETPGTPGVGLRLLPALEALERGLREGATTIELPVELIDPPERRVSRSHATFAERVGAYETSYARSGGRGRNIELAAGLLDGVTIPPGGVLSFNQIVGERTRERGFRPAVEIRSGRRVDGVGGGVCQVAATLHAAAFLGGFDVLEHHPHSRNLGYVDPGLDAAVAWDQKDLRLRNPTPDFIRVRARVHGGSLRVDLMGPRPGPPVDWNAEVVEELEPDEERIEDPTLAPGEERVEDEGEAGLTIRRTRVVHTPHGPRADERTIRYPAASRVVRFGSASAGG